MPRSAAFAALLVPCLCSAQYTVEVLHSPAVPSVFSFGWGAGGGQQVGHTNILLGGPSKALLWSGTAGSFVNLHPAGFDASYAMGVSDGKQVGWREVHGPIPHVYATMWSGTASSWVDLHNEKFSDTRALGIGGDQQVGMGIRSATPDFYDAVLWTGTPGSAVSLHPGGAYETSRAIDTDGIQQVGIATQTDPLERHAALWTGDAGSFVDLNPKGYVGSQALGVANGEQVGGGNFDGNGHALVWHGSAENYVDLNPGPNNEWGSTANATNGGNQVGFARGTGTGFQFHAARWSGTASSFFDLHNLLPSQFIGSGAQSRAMGIDELGNIVGWAADLSDGDRAKAVVWHPVPEPSSALGLGVLLVLWVIPRRLRSAKLNHRMLFGSEVSDLTPPTNA